MRALIAWWLFHLGSVKWIPVIIASFFRALSAWHLIDWAWGAHFPFLWLGSFFLRGTLRTIDFPCTLSFPLSSSQAPLPPPPHPPTFSLPLLSSLVPFLCLADLWLWGLYFTDFPHTLAKRGELECGKIQCWGTRPQHTEALIYNALTYPLGFWQGMRNLHTNTGVHLWCMC